MAVPKPLSRAPSKPRTSFYKPTAERLLLSRPQPLAEKNTATANAAPGAMPKPAVSKPFPSTSTKLLVADVSRMTLSTGQGNDVKPSSSVPPSGSAATKQIKSAFADEGKTYCLDDFQIGKPLGRGRFGNVYKVQEKSKLYVCAMKVLFKSMIKKYDLMKQVTREIEIQRKLVHRHILRMHTYFYDATRIFMIVDLAQQGELYKHLQNVKAFDEKTSAKYTYQIASALVYCHELKVIHRDLKPENILIAANGELKVSDFGWSAYTAKIGEQRSTHCGTPDYQAPEMIASNASHNEKVDIWSLGCMLYEFLTGKPPFETKDMATTQRRIRACHFLIPPRFPVGAAALVKQLVVLDHTKRLPATEIVKDHWIVMMGGHKYE